MSKYIEKYWKTIDLHFHTRNGIDTTGKLDKSDYSHEKFYNRIKDFGIQIQAITNHNNFILGDHLAQSIICDRLNVSYIPGVEIDIKLNGNKKIFHCVFLLGPKTDIIAFSNRLNKKTDEKKEKNAVFYNEDEIGNLFQNTHFIYVFHGVKAKGLAYNQKESEDDKENIDWVCSAISNGLAEPVLFENTKPGCPYRLSNRFKDFTNKNHILKLVEQEVTTSDNKFDSDTDRQNSWKRRPKFAIFAEATYEGLEISVRHYKTRFSLVKEIIEPVSFIESINFTKRDDKVFHLDKSIELSPSLNVIIGNSGTGKTLLLNQIYFSLTGENLDISSSKNEKNKKNESIYQEKIGKNNILSLKYYNNQKPNPLEIAKIYQKLCKASDTSEIGELFGVSNTNPADSVLSAYITKIQQFSKKYKDKKANIQEGNDCLDSIKASIRFLAQNKTENIQVDLKLGTQNTQELANINNKKKNIENAIKDTSVNKWIESLRKILSQENLSVVSEFEKSFLKLKGILQTELNNISCEYNNAKADSKITEHINEAIEHYHSKLGTKTSTILKYENSISQQTTNLGLFLKKAISAEFSLTQMDITYPFEEIQQAMEDNHSNEYARISTTFTESDRIFSINNPLFTFVNCKTKLQKERFPLDDNKEIQSSICKLIDENIQFEDLILPKIQYSTDVCVEGTWKKITEINPGSLAKIYMDFYFKNIIEKQKPNVVFVDQPENDVDKTFISETLADFIVKNKTKTQFIITSHEPILAVNSDVNKIIEAYLDKNGAICYKDYGLESRPTKNHTITGVDSVAKILDGGKENVIKRNQIYGGSVSE